MKRLFGTKKPVAPPPTIEEANGRLTNRGDVLDDKIRKLNAELLKHKDAIGKARQGPAKDAAKKRALHVLKQKKLLESQRDQLYGQQMNMEQTAFAMESVQGTLQSVQAMKATHAEMTKAFKSKDLNIDAIEKLHDDMSDVMDRHQEIQDVMGQSFGVPDELDEGELLEELEGLEDELAAEGPSASGVPSYLQEEEQLPEAPHAQAAHARPQAVPAGGHDDFGLPAVPQRT